jgi:signal transduction histidine kinase
MGYLDVMSTSAPPADPQSPDSVELRRLAEEQAALRRVATVVADGAEPAEVFATVAAEVAQLIPADGAALTHYEPGGTVTVLGGWTTGGGYSYVGTTYPLEGTVSGRIFETGLPARIDSYADAPGPAPVAAREMGWHSSVGAPIAIGRRLWGTLAVVSRSEQPLPPDTERRLVAFSELVATAIANAEGREELTQLAEEQAALRRVATLVAEGAEPNRVFAAVAEEVAAMFGVPIATMLRFDPDGLATLLATAGAAFGAVGGRFSIENSGMMKKIFETGRSAQIDDWTDVPGPGAELARQEGIRWSVGVPIVVDRALWGMIIVASREAVSLEADVEQRLAKFTELVATAIANSQAHVQLAQLADEQAALRRVATLVAEGATPHSVFDAVRHEVSRMFNGRLSVLMRYEAGTATVLATADNYLGPVGRSWRVEDDDSAIATACRTGRPARADYRAPVHGAIAEAARREGAQSAVAVPVVVDGSLWGVMAVGSRETELLPVDIEDRLVNFTELLATAIANAEGRAELDASRARIVATADATRRRIERDLHDGAQQQLVSLALALRAAQATVPEGYVQHRNELSLVVDGLTSALDDLREIALGIHPAGLSDDGLTPALKRLVARSPIRVNLEVDADGRFPESVEVTAYYVVSEALTNAAKYAEAPVADVTVTAGGGALRVEVRDDGRGGANPAEGTGLIGLKDRVEAIGGTMRLTSPDGAGTLVSVVLPLGDRPSRLASDSG